MKAQVKAIIINYLSFLAQPIITHTPTTIAITGSVGKTTTRELLTTILSTHFNTLSTRGGLNTEIGILLSLLGQKSGSDSPLRWLIIIITATFVGLKLRLKRPHYDLLILELGADSPQDITKILRHLHPKISIITAITPVHLATGQFTDINDILHEKAKLAQGTDPTDQVFLNFDDPLVKKITTRATTISYGTNPEVQIRISNVKQINTKLYFQLDYQDATHNFYLNVLGTFYAHLCAPVISIALALGLTVLQIQTALNKFQVPAGRGRLLNGLNKSVIWDGSYNASPLAVIAALTNLAQTHYPRKIVLLGHLNELGSETLPQHEKIAKKAAAIADIFIFVSPHTVVNATITKNAPQVLIYATATAAADYLKTILKPNDIILIKGSQNQVRLEQAVRLLLQNPHDQKLTCRNDHYWLNH